MSTQEKAVSAVEIPNSYTEEAQARLQELRQMRERIPRIVIPADPTETSRLSSAASVPAEFVELTNVAPRITFLRPSAVLLRALTGGPPPD